ncbi:uncharacterized protein LOC133859447 [Alnus glutinosa]|uniref:uncharacterized protein LOC133859447 n=1 Tax=Alnus glutinosa TaxID=3517 RepID=UPI002D787696|nr:uncharacterized protein LOC133859447 [Alnus glutinosa]
MRLSALCVVGLRFSVPTIYSTNFSSFDLGFQQVCRYKMPVCSLDRVHWNCYCFSTSFSRCCQAGSSRCCGQMKTMAEGKDYCERKFNLLRSIFDQLVEDACL